MTNLAKYIDHTALKPVTTKQDIIKLCNEAKQYQFASVCINPCWVKLCSQELQGSNIDVCTVVGFPLGSTTSESKAFETKQAIENGATEIDMVINIGKIKSGDWEYVENDILAVVLAANGVVVKVILETCLLTNEEKIQTCEIVKKAGAHFVKTSTGFSTGGATIEDIKLMRKTVGEKFGVKASGGIRDYETATAMIDVGATRIGASAGIKIIEKNLINDK